MITKWLAKRRSERLKRLEAKRDTIRYTIEVLEGITDSTDPIRLKREIRDEYVMLYDIQQELAKYVK